VPEVKPDAAMSDIKVECYAGYKADQRPVRFSLGDRVLDITEIEDQWYSPSARYFRVRAGDGDIYILHYDEATDRWTLDGYRKSN
jgi:hypothetical protein